MRHWRSSLHEILGRAIYLMAHVLYWPSRIAWTIRRDSRRKLQVGAGKNQFPGWVNADIDPRAELIVILGWRLPFGRGTLDRIYLEHVLEHVSYDTAVSFLKETRRVLSKGGIVRIAVPDLEDIARGYLNDDWRTRFDWVNWPQFTFIATRAQMINIAFRWWGHAHLYDRQELARALTEAGYTQFQFVDRGKSQHPDLESLETRYDSTLVVEATNE